MQCIEEKSAVTTKQKSKRFKGHHIEQKTAILDTISSLISHFGKSFCYPSQAKLILLIEQWHGISMSRSTLNRRLAELVEEKCLHRIRRHKIGSSGKLEFWTTAYYILQQVVASVKRFFRSAVRVAEVFRVSNKKQYSLTTKRDIDRTSVPEAEQVPIDWIKDFRKQLQAA